MSGFFGVLLNLCKEYQSNLYVIIIVAACVIGTCMIWGGDTLEKAKKRLPWVVIGAIIIAGAVTIGAELATKAAF